MAKKKKNTNVIFNILALIGAAVACVGLFMDVWTIFNSSKLAYVNIGSAKLFAEWSKVTEALLCARIFEILAIVTILAIVISVVMCLVTGKITFLSKLLVIISLAAIVVAIICAIIFIVSNTQTDKLGVTIGIKGAVGFYLIAIGGLIGSVMVFLGARK